MNLEGFALCKAKIFLERNMSQKDFAFILLIFSAGMIWRAAKGIYYNAQMPWDFFGAYCL